MLECQILGKMLRMYKDINSELICIGGIPAVGKTTLGNLLSESYIKKGYKVKIVCPDKTRLALLGKPEGVITNDDLSMETTLDTIKMMASNTDKFLKEGNIVIVPSAFILERMRTQFEEIASNNNSEFKGFWLDAPYDIIKCRAENRISNNSNNHASAVVPSKELCIEGNMGWKKIDASINPEEMFDNVLKLLENK